MSQDPWDTPHLTSCRPYIDPSKITVCSYRWCPYAERAILVLLAKNLPFEVIDINPLDEPGWFLSDTKGKVPVLFHNKHIILDSLIISDYLDEMYPTPKLHPDSPAQKAKDRNLIKVSNRGMKLLYRMLDSIYRPTVTQTPEERQTLYTSLVEELGLLNKEMEKRGTDYLGGETTSMIDYMIWPYFEKLEMLNLLFPGEGFDLPASFPCLLSWVQRMKMVPAVARCSRYMQNLHMLEHSPI